MYTLRWSVQIVEPQKKVPGRHPIIAINYLYTDGGAVKKVPLSPGKYKVPLG